MCWFVVLATASLVIQKERGVQLVFKPWYVKGLTSTQKRELKLSAVLCFVAEYQPSPDMLNKMATFLKEML